MFDDWEDVDDVLVVEDGTSRVGLVVGFGVEGILLQLELKLKPAGLVKYLNSILPQKASVLLELKIY